MLEELIQYFSEFDPELKQMENESPNYSFQKLERYHNHQLLSEIEIDPHFHSATIRMFIGSYFTKWEEKDIYQFINELNANFRFASFYFTQNTLIMEQDVLFEEEGRIPPLIDYLLLLSSHAKDILYFQ